MIRYNLRNNSRLLINDSVEGERIETKIERIVHDNEPIKDGAPLIYTDRREGVRPSTNIRTDRFEVAIEATDKIAKSYTARRAERQDPSKVSEGKKEGESKSEESSKSTNGSEGEA